MRGGFLLLHPLIARLSTETAAFVSFWHLRRQRVCFWMHSDIHFCFLSLSLSPSSASPSFVAARPSFIVARRGLSFAHFCFSCHRLPFSRLLRLPFCRCQLLSSFIVPSSASHSFTSASHSFTSASRRHHCWPATRQLQLLIVDVDSLSS